MQNLLIEIWKPIPGYVGYYEVSNYGNVRSVNKRSPRTLVPAKTPHGHSIVKLYLYGFGTTKRVHNLVWSVFMSAEPIAVYHKDGNLSNNRLENLTTERSI